MANMQMPDIASLAKVKFSRNEPPSQKLHWPLSVHQPSGPCSLVRKEKRKAPVPDDTCALTSTSASFGLSFALACKGGQCSLGRFRDGHGQAAMHVVGKAPGHALQVGHARLPCQLLNVLTCNGHELSCINHLEAWGSGATTAEKCQCIICCD